MRRRGRSVSPTVAGFFLLALVVVSSAMGPIPHAVSSRVLAVALAAPTGGRVQGVTTWNGENVSAATTVRSAITTPFAAPADVHFTWTSSPTTPGGPTPPFTISVARLQMLYFGVVLDTRDVIDSNPVASTNGSFDMIYDPGLFRWLLAGTYAFSASLLTVSGTTAWSEEFFVHVTALATIGAAVPILLILIGGWEAYSLARSGREAAIPNRRPGSSKPPSDPLDGPPSSPPPIPTEGEEREPGPGAEP